jgi:hypothetical protein
MASPMDDVFRDVVSQLTGGLIHDMTTAIVGMVAIMVVLIGFDKLKDILMERQQDSALKKAREYDSNGSRALEPGDDVMYRYYKKKSQNAINYAAKGRG